ncbi:glycosyltransferase family 2 protein [Variovorax sp. ZS18.2.2]|uniref:glycosyltransferase family 2 protein n=1 Tax=Variovorax sp. ZS18.2.2 TaxID=2971255 RepID=UPI002150D092|nr:glycosyltransferase family 2 protein [Variovorax sp. ZS18.2.2]MCR6477859.1 glycosyltransferase family 2 protein [Variovorax sp. ZS18.2.2]
MFSKPTLPAAQPFPRRRRGLDIASSNAQLQRQIGLLEVQVKALDAQVRGMTQSSSWRLTAPLRWLGGHFQRIVRGVPAAAALAKRGSYADWVARYDNPGSDAREDSRRVEMAAWPTRPRFLVLTSNAASLQETTRSLAAQSYKEWKLQAGPPTAPVDADWIVWLEPGCTLSAHALFTIAKEIAAHPEARMLYADTDVVDAAGGRSDPCFKPDWNPDLFLSRNLFSPMGVVQTSLFDEAGGLNAATNGAQGFDLALRCVEHVRPDQIRHIPRILSHSSAPLAAPDAADAQALDRHFQRTGAAATAEVTPHGLRAHYALPEAPPFVSLVIPTRNGVNLVRQCIESIVLETAYPNYEILLVDNGSDDVEALAYFAALDAQPGITVIRDDRPFNYSALNNAAVAQARGELIGLLNNDIEVISSDWLHEMVSLALQPGVGAVGAKLFYPDMTIQHGGVVLGVGGMAGHAHKHLPSTVAGHGGRAQLVQNFSAVTAACLVVRKSLYEQVGGLDEAQLGVAYNDVDFCLRLREAGYRNVWTPYAELLHHESASRGLEVAAESRDRLARESAFMQSRWAGLIAHDPAYNPNLTLDIEDFDLAWPPRDPRSDAAPATHP